MNNDHSTASDRYLITLTILSILLLWTPCTQAFPAGPETRKLVKRVQPAFVFFSQGSGAVISPDGLVLTNSHVLTGDAKEFPVRLGDGRPFTAKLLGRDEYGDLALLQLKGASGLEFLPLCDPKKVKPGRVCMAVGNPFAVGLRDNQPTFSLGVVSAIHQLHGRYSDAIVTDVPINPGNSGGPLINTRGELIGINGMIRPSLGLRSNTGLAFAIPVNQIKLWIPILKASKDTIVYHGMISGIAFEEDVDLKIRGAVIKETTDHGEKFGFKVGDRIVSVNDYPVWNAMRFAGILGTYPEGSAINVDVVRGPKKKKVTVSFQLPPRKYANFRFAFRTPRRGERHLVVGSVEKGSTAEKEGLKVGDKVIAMGLFPLEGNPMLKMLWLKNIKFQIKHAARVAWTITRMEEGKTVTKTISYLTE